MEIFAEIDCDTAVKDIFSGLKRHTNRYWRVVIKQISRNANFALHILTSLMKISHMVHEYFKSSTKVADLIRLDVKFLSLTPNITSVTL